MSFAIIVKSQSQYFVGRLFGKIDISLCGLKYINSNRDILMAEAQGILSQLRGRG